MMTNSPLSLSVSYSPPVCVCVCVCVRVCVCGQLLLIMYLLMKTIHIFMWCLIYVVHTVEENNIYKVHVSQSFLYIQHKYCKNTTGLASENKSGESWNVSLAPLGHKFFVGLCPNLPQCVDVCGG